MSVESKLISAVLQDKQIHSLLQANVGEILRTHNDMWDFIRVYYNSYGAVPSVNAVKEKFPDFQYIEGLDRSEFYLNELRAEFLDSGVRDIIRGAAETVQSGDPKTALDALVTGAAEIKRLTSVTRDVDVADFDSTASHFEKVKELRERGSLGVKTGFPIFDLCLPSGIMPGHFGVILAFPAKGKSWLMGVLAVRAWKNGKTPLIVSLEMTEEEVRNRLLAIMGEGKFSHRKLSAADVDMDDFREWHDKTFEGMPPIHIISGGGEFSPSVLRGKIDQYHPDIVFLDYLNLMVPTGRYDGEVSKMKKLSTELKGLAIGAHIPVVAISSATPDSLTDMNSAPELGQVAWSRQISYDADWVVALGSQPGGDIMEVVFRKNRHGIMGEFYLRTDFDRGGFEYVGLENI